MVVSSASPNLPLEAENIFQIITLIRCSLMSLKKKKEEEEIYKLGGPSLSMQFQKVQFALFGTVSPIFEFHASILLPYIVTAMPIHQFCSTIFCHTLTNYARIHWVYSNQSVNSLFMSLKLLISYWCHPLPFFFFFFNVIVFFSVEETRSFVQ